MGLLQEFRAFAIKGSVIDLAVGVIIGAAFGKIVTSLVEDIIMPPLGLLLGRVDFADLKMVLQPASGENPAVTLNYGNFLNILLQFILLAFAVFLLVKAVMNAKARFDEPPKSDEPVVKECPLCLSEVPVKAVRCKFCTAELQPGTAGQS